MKPGVSSEDCAHDPAAQEEQEWKSSQLCSGHTAHLWFPRFVSNINAERTQRLQIPFGSVWESFAKDFHWTRKVQVSLASERVGCDFKFTAYLMHSVGHPWTSETSVSPSTAWDLLLLVADETTSPACRWSLITSRSVLCYPSSSPVPFFNLPFDYQERLLITLLIRRWFCAFF